MNRIALVLVMLFTEAASASDIVKIGSWNIEHLGSRTPPQRPIDIAEYIALSGVDVLGLIEIDDNDDMPMTRTNEALNTTFSLLNENVQRDWKYVLFQNRVPGDLTQLVGVAWDAKRVLKVGDPLKIDVQPDPNPAVHLWDRHPHAVKFQAGAGKTDFVLIAVHMKANVPTAVVGRKQRKKEAKALADKIPSVRTHFSDQDIVILGDTNILSSAEDTVTLIEDAGFEMLNDNAGTFVGTNSPAFDRIFVPAQPEFENSRQYILTPAAPEAHNEHLSDHFMILTSIRIVADDD